MSDEDQIQIRHVALSGLANREEQTVRQYAFEFVDACLSDRREPRRDGVRSELVCPSREELESLLGGGLSTASSCGETILLVAELFAKHGIQSDRLGKALNDAEGM